MRPKVKISRLDDGNNYNLFEFCNMPSAKQFFDAAKGIYEGNFVTLVDEDGVEIESYDIVFQVKVRE